jgi:hypothetical protein
MVLYSTNGRVLITSGRWKSRVSENAAEDAVVFLEATVLGSIHTYHAVPMLFPCRSPTMLFC